MITDLSKLKPDISMLRTLRGRWRMHELYQGCVGHWLFNEGFGLTVRDLSVNAFHGTLTNGPTWGTGKYGRALNVDATDDLVNVGGSETLNLPQDLSISAWIRPISLASHFYIFGKMGFSTNRGYIFFVRQNTDNNLESISYFADDAQVTASGTNSIVTGSWQHVAVTRKVGSQILYINGNQVVETTHAGGSVFDVSTQTASIHEGFGTGGLGTSFINGQIDDVRVYKRILAPKEVRTLRHDPFISFRSAYEQNKNRFFSIPVSPTNRLLSLSAVLSSATPDVDSILVRSLSLNSEFSSFTPDIDIEISVDRMLMFSSLIASVTPDIDSILDRSVQLSVSMGSTTPDVNGILDRSLSGLFDTTSDTPSIDAILDRSLSSAFAHSSLTPSVDAILDRVLSVAVALSSLTPDIDIDISGSRLLSMGILVSSLTPLVNAILDRELSGQWGIDSATPSIDHQLDRSLSLSVLMSSLTPDIDVDITGNRLLSMAVQVASLTPAINGLLERALSLQSGQTSITPSILQILDRELLASFLFASLTADIDAIVVNGRILSMDIPLDSTTSDASAILDRELAMVSLMTSVTPDMDSVLDRELGLSVALSSLTPDDVAAILGGLGVIIDPGVVSLTRRKRITRL